MNTNDRSDGIHGASIQVDPLFPYYAARSADSVAEEIEGAGYKIVHYFVVNERKINGELIRAFRARGMFVWALVLGNGTFSTDAYPEDWPNWQMGLLRPCEDGYTRLSYFSEHFVKWKKQELAELVQRYPFDGIEIAEPYFPEWDGIHRGVYGDVGPLAQAAFQREYGMEMPDFVNTGSLRHYKRDVSRYRAWVQFRIKAVNRFVQEMIDGEGGARTVRPELKVATWSLAVDDGNGSADRLREWQGLDAASMIEAVRPDMHVLQTHWPDWSKDVLAPDYIRSYAPFVQEIRHAHPDLPIIVQADIGSARNMVRSRSWLSAFISSVTDFGYAGWTAYEYHIGGYMYESRPFPIGAVRLNEWEAIVSFNKRIDPASCRKYIDHFGVYDEDGFRFARIEAFRVDGSRLYLRSVRFPRSSFELTIPRIQDTPELWLLKDSAANEAASGSHIRIPSSFV